MKHLLSASLAILGSVVIAATCLVRRGTSKSSARPTTATSPSSSGSPRLLRGSTSRPYSQKSARPTVPRPSPSPSRSTCWKSDREAPPLHANAPNASDVRLEGFHPVRHLGIGLAGLIRVIEFQAFANKRLRQSPPDHLPTAQAKTGSSRRDGHPTPEC